jgi:hypothetical protein
MIRNRTTCLCLSSLALLLLMVGIFGNSVPFAGLSHASQGSAAAEDEQEIIPRACCANKAADSDSCCVQKSGEVQAVAAAGLDSTVAVLFAEPEKAKSAKVELETTEGCECVAPCPCASIGPASFDHCRALKFYQVQTGEVDGLDLKGLVFVAAISDSPKKMYELRDWKGALYLPESASDAQRKALRRVADNIWRGVYREFETRVAALTYTPNGDARVATIGTVGHLSTSPLFGPDGTVKPFPRNPKSKSEVSLRNHFDDGQVKWDLAGRSARVAPMTVFVAPAKSAEDQAGL